MWIKFLGAMMIIISGTALGWMKAADYIKRVKILNALQVLIVSVDAEISFKQTPLPRALRASREIVSQSLGEILGQIAWEMEEGSQQGFARLWQQALKEEEPFSFLTAGDLQILKEWGQGMGCTGLDEQTSINQMTQKKLKEAERQAREVADKKVKLSRYSGVLLGLMVVILLF